MTKLQVEWYKVNETERANRANEEILRQRLAQEKKIAADQLAETSRHNYAAEQVSFFTAREGARHNQAVEGLQSQQLSEAQRHNLANEGIAQHEADTKRAQYFETTRHNAEVEQQGRTDVATRQAAQKAQQLYWERMAHNAAQEISLGFSQLQEAQRHNRETELLQSRQAATQAASVNETGRHNREQEQIAREQTQQRDTASKRQSQVGMYQAIESKRHNQATEGISQQGVQQRQQEIDLTAQRVPYQNFRDATAGAKSISDVVAQTLESTMKAFKVVSFFGGGINGQE